MNTQYTEQLLNRLHPTLQPLLYGIAIVIISMALAPTYSHAAYDAQCAVPEHIIAAEQAVATIALFESVIHNNIYAAHQAINKGALINAIDIRKHSPMFNHTPLRISATNNYSDMIQLLLENKACIDNQNLQGDTALTSAIGAKHSNTVYKLLQYKANINTQNNKGNTALICAVHQNNTEITHMLLEYQAQVDVQNKAKDTALIWATRNNNLAIVELLLQHTANPNILNEFKNNALTIAAQSGYTAIVAFLLNHKASNAGSDLAHAIRNKRAQTVDILLQHKTDPNKVYDDKKNSFLLLATQQNNTEAVKSLLYHKAHVDHQNIDEYTALMESSYSNYTQITNILLQNKANTNIQGENGFTALIFAAQKGHSDTVLSLLTYKAYVNHQTVYGDTALIWAAQNKHLESVNLLLQHKANPDIHERNGTTALISAAKNGHSDIVLPLLTHKAYVNHQTVHGDTALIWATHNKHLESINLLLQHKANPNSQEKRGYTALMIAARKKDSPEIIKTLILHGSDPSLLDNKEKSALDMVDNETIEAISGALREKISADMGNQEWDSLLLLHSYIIEKYLPTSLAILVGDYADPYHPSLSYMHEYIRILLQNNRWQNQPFSPIYIPSENDETTIPSLPGLSPAPRESDQTTPSLPDLNPVEIEDSQEIAAASGCCGSLPRRTKKKKATCVIC